MKRLILYRILIYFAGIYIIFGSHITPCFSRISINQIKPSAVTVASYKPYTAEQIALLDMHYNTIIFSRESGVVFRNKFGINNYNGMYVNFMMIHRSEKDIAQNYIATDPITGLQFYYAEYDAFLARFWDPAWWAFRLGMIPDLYDSIDFLFLDSMSLRRFEWINQIGGTLPYDIDTDDEWRIAGLNMIAYLRKTLPSTIYLGVNSIKGHAYDDIYNGFDVVGQGYADFAVLESFISDTNNDRIKQIRDMQLINRASILKKNLFSISKVKIDSITTSAELRIDYLAKYLLVADSSYTAYMVSSINEWAVSPPLFSPEIKIEFGKPLDPVPEYILTCNTNKIETCVPNPGILSRQWDSGFLIIVNMSNSSGQLVPLSTSILDGKKGLILHP